MIKFELYQAVEPTFTPKLQGEYQLVDIIYAKKHEEIYARTQGTGNYRSTSVGDYVVNTETREIFMLNYMGWKQITSKDLSICAHEYDKKLEEDNIQAMEDARIAANIEEAKQFFKDNPNRIFYLTDGVIIKRD